MKREYVIYNYSIEGYLSQSEYNLELEYSKVLDQYTVYFETYSQALSYCNENEEPIKII